MALNMGMTARFSPVGMGAAPQELQYKLGGAQRGKRTRHEVTAVRRYCAGVPIGRTKSATKSKLSYFWAWNANSTI